MKQIERWRGGAALLLGALLSLPLSAVQPMTVHAAGREVRSVNVSIGDELGIANPEPPQNDTDEWKGDRVIFGEHGGNPITFRVLDKKTTDFGGTTMLLDCDSILYDRAFNETTASPSNVWKESPLRNELNGSFLNNRFTPEEKDAIHKSQAPSSHASWPEVWGNLNYGELSADRDKIFVLDAREAEHEAYGYSHTDQPAANRVKSGGHTAGFGCARRAYTLPLWESWIRTARST